MAKKYFEVRSVSGLMGPFPLNAANVNRLDDHPGIYILSDRDATNRRYLACYVGRSGSLPVRLAKHVGKYDYFFVKYHDTEAGAFFTECRLFHNYGKANHLDNRIHPAVPRGSSLPVCSEAGCYGEAR